VRLTPVGPHARRRSAIGSGAHWLGLALGLARRVRPSLTGSPSTGTTPRPAADAPVLGDSRSEQVGQRGRRRFEVVAHPGGRNVVGDCGIRQRRRGVRRCGRSLKRGRWSTRAPDMASDLAAVRGWITERIRETRWLAQRGTCGGV
jgi:hypothetical protein